GRQHRHGLGDDRTQVVAQLAEVGLATAQYRARGRVFEQGEQQVLDGHELVALLARLLVALTDGELEILAEHVRFSGNTACNVGVTQGFSMLQNKGCWWLRENSLTWVTFVSATSRVNVPQMPLPRVCTWSITWLARSRSIEKNVSSTATTNSIGVKSSLIRMTRYSGGRSTSGRDSSTATPWSGPVS